MSRRRADLTPSLLLNAYAAGVFPMADSADAAEIFWVDPHSRGVLPLDAFRAPRSLQKQIRRGGYSVTIDRAFAEVLDGCADRPETWINAPIRDLYSALFDFGYCHSVEVWMDGALAGGLYGVSLGGVFFGESMFTRRPGGSKIALVHLVARLKAGNFALLDTQFVTPHLRGLGACEIPRRAYHAQLALALERDADFLRLPPQLSPHEVLQLSTQKS